MVSTLDFESSDPSSNLGGTCNLFFKFWFHDAKWCRMLKSVNIWKKIGKITAFIFLLHIIEGTAHIVWRNKEVQSYQNLGMKWTAILKFIYSEKAKQYSPYFWLSLHRTKVRWRFPKFFGLLRIYELYKSSKFIFIQFPN